MTRSSFKILFILLLAFTGTQAQKQTVIDNKYMDNGIVSLPIRKDSVSKPGKGIFFLNLICWYKLRQILIIITVKASNWQTKTILQIPVSRFPMPF